MKNFKHLPEPFRIRVIEPVKHTTRAYREEAITKSGMNPFLLNSESVFIDLLTDSGTGAMTQSMQAAMMRDDETYSDSHSYYALAESVESIFSYQCTIPTHQGRGAEQIYVPVLIKKRGQRKGLDYSKMVAFSNYFSDTTQGYSQINGCIVRNVHAKEAFDTGMRYNFKGNFGFEGLERGIEEVGPNNMPYVVATIINNSAGGQPVLLTNLKTMYSVAKKYDIPVVTDSARFAENAYFTKQREAEYKDRAIEQITRKTYKYASMLVMSAKKDTIVLMGGLLCVKGGSFFDMYTEYKTPCVTQEGSPTYSSLEGGAVECLAVGLYDGVSLDQLACRIAQVQYLINGLEEIDVVCQQASGHTTFVDAGKLLLRIPADRFSAQALTCELYKVAGIRTVKVDSFLLGRDPKTSKQLPYPAELLRLTIPHATYTQTHMDFIIETFKRVKGNAANIKGLTFTYEPKVLRHFTAKLKEI